MFTQSAAYYDAIYAAVGKNYNREADLLADLVQRHKHSDGQRLLDVGCGTGGHIGPLSSRFDVSGLDLDSNVLAVARQKLPAITFYQADMADFELNQSFDVVACLFSSIGYVKTLERMQQAVSVMARHVATGGLLLVEPWFAPGDMTHGYISAVFVDQPELKIARLSTTLIDGTISMLDFHYLIATPGQVQYAAEQHELGLFTQQEYMSAFDAAELETTFDPEGLDGRGLYIGLKTR